MLVAPRYEEFAYNRRVPEQELLHQVLVEHLETFLDRARGVPHWPCIESSTARPPWQ